MSPPPRIRQITREMLGADVPAWLDTLLTPLNKVLTQVGDLFSNNLTVSENLAMRWVEVQVVEGSTPAPTAVELAGRVPKGVSVERVAVQATGSTAGTPPTGPVTVEWLPVTVAGKPGIQLTRVWGLATGSKATLALLVKAD